MSQRFKTKEFPRNEEAEVKKTDVNDEVSDDEEVAVPAPTKTAPKTTTAKGGARSSSAPSKEDKIKKNSKQHTKNTVRDFLISLPDLIKTVEGIQNNLKKVHDKIKNKNIADIKFQNIKNKSQKTTTLHPIISKYSAEYGLNPNESFTPFKIVGNIKGYIFKSENKDCLVIPRDENGAIIKGGTVLGAPIDIKKNPVLKGTFGKLIELMKESDQETFRKAANDCTMSNIQTFCSILQYTPGPGVDKDGKPIKISALQAAKNLSKQQILDKLAVHLSSQKA